MENLNNQPNMEEIDGFEKILKEVLELKKRKAGDYGNTWRIFGIEGIYSAIARKFSRLWINKNRKEVNNEMLRDTLRDLGVYAFMAIQLLDENDTEDKIEKILKS